MNKNCPVCAGDLPEGAEFCPSCGFKLLGQTESFEHLPVDRAALEAEPERPETVLRMKVLRGPAVGRVYELPEGELLIGRSPSCTIFLNDMTVSREHARIRRTGDVCTVEDLDSYNGTWVNNDSVTSRTLKHGDILQVGAFLILYEEKAG